MKFRVGKFLDRVHYFKSLLSTLQYTELNGILTSVGDTRPIFMLYNNIYTDVGPDHCLTYLSVQLTLIALFLSTNLDMVVAVRTQPYHSWCNLVERIMSILNLVLQSVGLMQYGSKYMYIKQAKSKSKNKEDIQADTLPEFHDAFVDSIERVKLLLQSLFPQLQFKGKEY